MISSCKRIHLPRRNKKLTNLYIYLYIIVKPSEKLRQKTRQTDREDGDTKKSVVDWLTSPRRDQSSIGSCQT